MQTKRNVQTRKEVLIVKPRKNGQKNKNWRDGLLAGAPNAFLTLPKTVTQIFPDRFVTRLTYNGYAILSIAAGAQHATRRWAPTSAYDVDPLLGSTTMVGFNEFASIYGNYRVFHSKMTVKFSNTSTGTAVQGIIIPLNTDPGSTPLLAVVQEWINNAYNKHGSIPLRGGPVMRLSRSMSTEKIFGSKSVYFDDDFASLVTTVPANNWYWALGIVSPTVAAAAADVAIEVDLQIDVEFFSRRNLAN